MDQKRILLVDVPRALSEALSPLFSRKGMAVESVRGGTGLTTRIRQNRFELILIAADGIDPMFPQLLGTIRKKESPCRTASVLLSGIRAEDPIAQAAIESGANGVLDWPAPEELCRERIAKYLDIPIRRDVRVLVKLKVLLETRTRRILCESQNLSKGGILLRLADPIDLGAEVQLEFTLPGEPLGVSLRARVVRHTRTGKEPITGVGLQFMDVPKESEERLEHFLSQ